MLALARTAIQILSAQAPALISSRRGGAVSFTTEELLHFRRRNGDWSAHRMSALGQKQTFEPAFTTSALPPKADIRDAN